MKMGSVALLVILAMAVGFFAGRWHAGPELRIGTAHVAADGGGTIMTDDWSYGLPGDVQWTDATASWHDSGHPDCLPPLEIVANVRFATVDVSLDRGTWRQVVWVDCQSVSR